MSRSRVAVAISSAVLAATTLSAAGPAAAAPIPSVASAPVVQAAQTDPWPALHRGATGETVRSLQYLLRAHGYTVGVDGAFGPRTDAALRAFQRHEGIAADGVTSPTTWRALVVTVRYGSKGDAVRAVQSQFQFRNGSGDPGTGLQVDGVFGSRTRTTVRAFQGAVGLSRDGIVGPLTWNHLIGGSLSL